MVIQTALPILTLKPGKSNPFRLGHPWVFSGAIARIDGNPQAGDWVCVVDEQTHCIGYGFFNPHSLYRVRLLTSQPQEMTECLRTHLQRALQRRQTCHLPHATTTAYRLCNSEGDQLSGLTIDIYGSHAVISPSAYWVMQHRILLDTLLHELLPTHTISWKPVIKPLAQDGWKTFTEASVLSDTLYEIQEHGLFYQIALTGQKTGFFCDQRDNRWQIRQFAAGRRVLDTYCYSGGFALNAAAAGASQVTGVDSSAFAIQMAQHNATRNQLTVEFQEADAFTALAASSEVDLICLDPPKVAPSRHHVTKALRYYTELHQLALEKLTAGGILFTCSCSASLTALDLVRSLQEAAHRTQRTISILSHTRAGPDHPVAPALFDTTDYLHGLWVSVYKPT